MAYARSKTLTVGKKMVIPLASVPGDLRNALTFVAALRNSFVASGRGDASATFTRSTVATYIDKTTGLLTDVASGVGRFESGAKLEGQRTNLALRSEEFDNAVVWTVSKAFVTANDTDAPDGTATGDNLSENGLSGGHTVFTNYTRTASSKQGVGGFMKAGTRDWGWIGCGDRKANVVFQFFDLANGAVGSNVVLGAGTSVVAGSPKITAVPGAAGWYWCETVVQTPADVDGRYQVGTATGDGVWNYLGTGNYIYIWGAQVEDNVDFTSSYIPTAAAAVTRNQDTLKYPGAGNSVIGAASVFVVTDTAHTTTQQVAFINQLAAGTDGLFILLQTSEFTKARTTAAAAVGEVVSTDKIIVDTTTNFAVSYSETKLTLFQDGVSYVDDTVTGAPRVENDIVVGALAAGGSPLFGHVRDIMIFNQQLSDFDVARVQQ